MCQDMWLLVSPDFHSELGLKHGHHIPKIHVYKLGGGQNEKQNLATEEGGERGRVGDRKEKVP